MKVMRGVAAGLLVLAMGSAQAMLIDRGGGLLYDDVLKVTWLQDANYANAQYGQSGGALGVNGGLMGWDVANTWATNLVYHDVVRNVDLSGWRLPSNSPVNGHSFNYSYSPDGSTDFSFNIASPTSELSYMYYENLGLKGMYSPGGGYQPNFGVFRTNHFGGQTNVGLVNNIQSYLYWSAATIDSVPLDTAWSFDTYGGYQHLTGSRSGLFSSDGQPANQLYAWAVRDGDVIPEPTTLALLGIALAGLGATRRKKAI